MVQTVKIILSKSPLNLNSYSKCHKQSCSWIGLDISGNPTSSEGAGHFVKTVHNGIGYADMQLLAEAYHLMRDVLNMAPPDIAEVGSLVSNTN